MKHITYKQMCLPSGNDTGGEIYIRGHINIRVHAHASCNDMTYAGTQLLSKLYWKNFLFKGTI